MKALGKKTNELLNFQEHQVNEFVVDNIKRESYANDKNINVARKKEKDRTNYESRISTKLPVDEPDRIIQAEKTKPIIEQKDDDEENITNTIAIIQDDSDEFEPYEDLRTALKEHENRGRD